MVKIANSFLLVNQKLISKKLQIEKTADKKIYDDEVWYGYCN
jgi:hypothetical protein